MKVRTVISMAAAAVVLASELALPAAASAASTSATAAAPTTTGQGIFVLGSPSTRTPEGTQFYAIPDEYRDALVIAPDVAADLHLPPGPVPNSDVPEVTAKVAAVEEVSRKSGSKSPASSFTTMDASSTSFTYGPGTAWLGPYQRNTARAGCCYHYYSWYVDPSINTDACLQGQGWYTGYNGGSFGLWSGWYSLGCGKSGGATVPWDNVSSYPKVMARSMYGYYGGGVFT